MPRDASFDLTGKIAVVTGAGKGIGYAIAKALARAGSDLVGISRTPSDLDALASDIAPHGRRMVKYSGDISILEHIDRAVDLSLREFGRVDILVNNAGIVIPQPGENVDEESWDKTMGTNLKGLFFCAQRFGRVMMRQGKGKIINISSILAFTALDKHITYCASKGGVTMITKCLALEWGRYGINVNGVAPTFIRTPLSAPNLNNPQMHAWILDRTPIGRIGEPEDVVGAVIYLASSASDLVTGETIIVDGGWMAI